MVFVSVTCKYVRRMVINNPLILFVDYTQIVSLSLFTISQHFEYIESTYGGLCGPYYRQDHTFNIHLIRLFKV